MLNILRILILSLSFLPSLTVFGEELPLQNDPEEVKCLALNIFFEARGESNKGKIAVGHVVLNRLNSAKFPDTVCKIVYQKHQFSWVRNIPNWRKYIIPMELYDLADDILVGKYMDVTNGALYFHNKAVKPFSRRVVARVGGHIFYK